MMTETACKTVGRDTSMCGDPKAWFPMRVKHNRKLLKANTIPPERMTLMGNMVDLCEESKRKKQYI